MWLLLTSYRSHLNFIKDHSNVLWTLFRLLRPVIFGRFLRWIFGSYVNYFWRIYVQSLELLFHSCLQLVVVRADLNGHLKALKDYFLLAKGDFFQVKHELWSILKFWLAYALCFSCCGLLIIFVVVYLNL